MFYQIIYMIAPATASMPQIKFDEISLLFCFCWMLCSVFCSFYIHTGAWWWQSNNSFIPKLVCRLNRLVRIRYCVALVLIIWLNSDQKVYHSFAGDLHGQFDDLLRIFQLLGHPPDTKYLFLGNYVSRGLWSIEIVCLLLVYKLKYPQSIHILRAHAR